MAGRLCRLLSFVCACAASIDQAEHHEIIAVVNDYIIKGVVKKSQAASLGNGALPVTKAIKAQYRRGVNTCLNI